MPKRHEPKDLELIFAEIKGENDRAAIIVGVSTLENALEKAIISCLRTPETNSENEALFGSKGILSSFYDKIWLAYFLKIIGPITRRDIDMLRSIRNEVAHNMNPISFDMPEIADRLKDLEFANQTIPGQMVPPDLKGKFLFTIQCLTAFLWLRSEKHQPFVGDLEVFKWMEE